MDVEVRDKPIVTGKDAVRFLEKVPTKQQKSKARRAQRKKLIGTVTPSQSLAAT